MSVLNMNEDEKTLVVAALHRERVRLIGEWSKAFADEEGSGFYRDSEMDRLAAAIDLATDLCRKVENAPATRSAYKSIGRPLFVALWPGITARTITKSKITAEVEQSSVILR